jgi:glycosyltransferase involved in cell wall biosynthesis
MSKIMASGRPIVALADPHSDVARLVRSAQCGVVVGPRDARGLAESLRKFAAYPAELGAMGQNARRFLVENFDRHRCVAQIESVLLGAANG